MLIDVMGLHPEPGLRSMCSCGGRLIARCGEVKVWHWAHEPGESKDPWHEGESAWHLETKQMLLNELIDWKDEGKHVEARVEHDGVVHVADVMVGDWIIEVQHSPLSRDDVHCRELFYGTMCWVLSDRFNLEITPTRGTRNGVYKIYKIAEAFRGASRPILFMRAIEAWKEWEPNEFGSSSHKEYGKHGLFLIERQWEWRGRSYLQGKWLDLFEDKKQEIHVAINQLLYNFHGLD